MGSLITSSRVWILICAFSLAACASPPLQGGKVAPAVAGKSVTEQFQVWFPSSAYKWGGWPSARVLATAAQRINDGIEIDEPLKGFTILAMPPEEYRAFLLYEQHGFIPK